MPLFQFKGCEHCGGDAMLISDPDGEYFRCFLCGRHAGIESGEKKHGKVA